MLLGLHYLVKETDHDFELGLRVTDADTGIFLILTKPTIGDNQFIVYIFVWMPVYIDMYQTFFVSPASESKPVLRV